MKRCLGCFQVVDDSYDVCPYCGYKEKENDVPRWILPPGTILNGKYQVGRSLGEGGFGITYLAWDVNMETKIAIKEYFPANIVSRDNTSEGGNHVAQNVTVSSLNFDEGLKRYVKEASILAKFFDLPGIVSVKDFFYENGTAYFVMEYIDGMSLKDYLSANGGKIGYEEAIALMQPVISSLYVIHQNNLLHRDISPDNIMISSDGQIKLIDFGAARSMEQAADNGMTVMLKHGYAPIEQYSRNGAQGPFTDVYGVCAVLYRMITGNVPADATDRATGDGTKSDILVPIKKVNRKVPGHIAQAIEKGLSVLPENRQQDMQQLYDDLYISRKGVVTKKVDTVYTMIIKALAVVAGILALIVVLGIAYQINYDKFENVRGAFAVLFDRDTGNIDTSDEEDTESNSERTSLPAEEIEEKTADAIDAADVNEVAADTQTQTDSDSAVNETISNDDSARTDSSQDSEIYRYGYTTDEEMNTAIEAVQNGVLDSSNTPVSNILEAYSERSGVWEGYRSENGKIYVKYTGYKGGSEFAIIFEITSNKSSSSQIYISFKVSGALEDGRKIDDYNKYFKQIVKSY